MQSPKARQQNAKTMHAASLHTGSALTLDMRCLGADQRPPRFLAAFDELKTGAAVDLIDDHDPRTVFEQLQAERYGQCSWLLLESGPDIWRVRVGRTGGRTGGRCCGQCG